jgi:hypothetical protein
VHLLGMTDAKPNAQNLPIKSIEKSYYKWFDFANMSRNPSNTEKDFSIYKENKAMAEVINRLRKDKFIPEEFQYISDFDSYEIL